MIPIFPKLALLGSLLTSVLALQDAELGQKALIASAAADPTIAFQSGTIVGTATVVPSTAVTVNKYLGIPYAVSPPQRFSPPENASTLTTTMTAQTYKPACFQQFRGGDKNDPAKKNFSRAVFGGTPQNVTESEDCLYLNIFSPDTPTTNKTVMFWIFGGGLTFGHAGQDLYDGSNLAANQDVVVVTINYRTNVFGFSNSPNISRLDQNAGFLDQRKALGWVHANIANFGGDPDKVTIFGQSAGAKSADRMVLNPPVPFKAAILQSDVATFGTNIYDHTMSWKSLADRLHCRNFSNGAQELTNMRELDPTAIQAAVDDSNLFFVQQTDDVTKLTTPVDRTQQNFPLLIGSTGQEARVFEVGESSFTTYLKEFCSTDQTDRTIIKTCIKHLTSPYHPASEGNSDYDDISQLVTERDFQCPIAFTTEELVKAQSPTWRYLFNASFANTNPSAALNILGSQYNDTDLMAFHTSDIAYVFGNLPPGSEPAQYELSNYMQTAWANFAKNPSGGPGHPEWKNASVGVMVLGGPGNGTAHFVEGFELDSRCSLWKDYIYGGGAD